jgi:hypothetical protein
MKFLKASDNESIYAKLFDGENFSTFLTVQNQPVEGSFISFSSASLFGNITFEDSWDWGVPEISKLMKIGNRSAYTIIYTMNGAKQMEAE